MDDADDLHGNGDDDVFLRGGDGDDRLDGGPGTELECLGAEAGDLDDTDEIRNCEA